MGMKLVGRSVNSRPEQEATVPETPAPGPQPGCISPPGLAVRRAETTVPEADPMGGGPVPGDVLAILRRRHGSGQPLPESVAGPIGEQLGISLDHVRVHADAESAAVSRSLP